MTTAQLLIQKKLFRDGSTLRNVGLVIALFLQSTHLGCKDAFCQRNENEWAAKVVSLAMTEKLTISGVDGIESTLQAIAKRETRMEDEREARRIKEMTVLVDGRLVPPTLNEIGVAAVLEGKTPRVKGTGL